MGINGFYSELQFFPGFETFTITPSCNTGWWLLFLLCFVCPSLYATSFFYSFFQSAAPAKLYPPSFFFFNFVVTCDILSQAYLLCFSLCLFLSFLLGRSSCLFSAFFSSTSSWKIHWQLRFKMGVELNVIFSLKHFHHPTCHASSYSSV